MNPEYILDVLGLLDDDLIREAETCTAPRRQSSYRSWVTLAACLVVVIALGYVMRNGIGMGGSSAGGGAAPEFSGTPSTSSGGTQDTDELWGQDASNGENTAPDPAGPAASIGSPEDPGATDPQSPSDALEEGQLFAVLADGTVYQATEETVPLEPAESDVQYTVGGKEEDASFLPAGTAYVMLEPGVAAVRMEEDGSWQIFISVEP